MSDPGASATTTAGSTGSTTTPSTSTSSSTSGSTGATSSSSSNNNNNNSSSSSTTTANTTTTPATTTVATSSGGTSSSSTSSNSSSTTTTGRQAVPQISVYGGITDRQTVQVFQQALHRQPNTAAQYLQQMYAAQQQHLMLQTAALQQQHNLSTAQLQSLQASIAAGRQNSSQNGTSSQQTGSTQATINLTTSPAAAQLISRAQSISSTPTSISQQAVLLGGPSNPTLTASQAQMYLRAQMAQQSNLVQVARSLGRAVPLSPQLIFTPTATVTAVQSENSQASSQNQVQNLAIRGQQGAASSSSQAQTLQALSLKQSPVAIQPASLKNPGQGSQASTGGRSGSTDGSSEGGKKADTAPVTEVRAINMSRNVTAPPLIAPAYTQIQPQSLVQPHKQQQQQFVVHQSSQRTGQMLQTASIQPSQHPVPVLPKPANHQSSTPSQQATIFHSTISPHALHSSNNHAKAQPVQLTAINLQIQPTAPRLLQDNKDKPTSLVVRETCASSKPPQKQTQQAPPQQQPAQQQQPQPKPAPSPLQPTKPAEPQKVDPVAPAVQPPGVAAAKRQPAATPPPVMTSGTESEAPTMTGCTPQNGENKPPQAIVKPQVLTHVIEGFVIQEGAEPFPVCVERLPVLIDSPRKLDHQLSSDPDKTPVSNAANSDSEPDELNPPGEPLKLHRDCSTFSRPKLTFSDSPVEKEQEPKLTCEYCGWVDFAYTFKGSKRFCSVVCAKRYSLSCTKRLSIFRPDRSKPAKRWHRRGPGRPSLESKKQKLSPPQQTASGSVSSPHLSQPSQEESSPCSDMSSYEEPQSPASAASSGPPAPTPVQPQVHRQQSRTSDHEDRAARDAPTVCQRLTGNDPTRWNVEQVYEFICSLPGCQEIADEFRSQEIDGQALLLLKEDHLMSTMNIKLGPALKIFARINMLKDS
ncbi:polyhomeotic-like protein 2b [Neosynchiropus ocellatus]